MPTSGSSLSRRIRNHASGLAIVTASVATVGFLALRSWGATDAPGLDYFLVLNDPIEVRARAENLDAAVHARIQQCMERLGFVYEAATDVPRVSLEADPIAWAKVWGFGITTMANGQGTEESEDPNSARVQALPPAERERYLIALLGDDRQEGCLNQANRLRLLRRDAVGDLAAPMAELQASLETDPAVTRAEGSWLICAEPTGPPSRTRNAAVMSTTQRFSRELALATGAGTALLEALQLEERRVATRFAECDAAFLVTTNEIKAQYEARFVTQHLDELRAMRTRLIEVDRTLRQEAQAFRGSAN
jgi:hypothetical protein